VRRFWQDRPEILPAVPFVQNIGSRLMQVRLVCCKAEIVGLEDAIVTSWAVRFDATATVVRSVFRGLSIARTPDLAHKASRASGRSFRQAVEEIVKPRLCDERFQPAYK